MPPAAVLKHPIGLPTPRAMSVSSGVRPVGTVLGVPANPEPAGDPQDALLAELVRFMTKDTPSVQHVLNLAEPYLRVAAGLTAATVFELDSETGRLNSTAQLGTPGGRDLLTAGKVFRMAAGAKPLVDGERTAIRLRIGGQTVGVLLLTGTYLDALRDETIAPLALHFATTLQELAAEKQRQWVSHSAATIRGLFENGIDATNVEAAGRILATTAAEAFHTDGAALCLIDAEGIIRYAHTVGLPDDERLAALVGTPAVESPFGQTIAEGKPALVGDATASPVRSGGPVQILGLRSYIAMPMLSAEGAVGMILCGDAGGAREWTSRDRMLAEHLAVEGVLIVHSAGMRQAAQAHVAELSHQAFHDALTGLPNRSYLAERAEQAVQRASANATRAALLLLDLTGFKEVNDPAGHQAPAPAAATAWTGSATGCASRSPSTASRCGSGGAWGSRCTPRTGTATRR